MQEGRSERQEKASGLQLSLKVQGCAWRNSCSCCNVQLVCFLLIFGACVCDASQRDIVALMERLNSNCEEAEPQIKHPFIRWTNLLVKHHEGSWSPPNCHTAHFWTLSPLSRIYFCVCCGCFASSQGRCSSHDL